MFCHQYSAACMEMQFSNSFQRHLLQMSWSCSTYFFVYVLMFLNSHRVIIFQKTLCIQRSIDWKSWSRLLHMLGFAAWPPSLIFTVIILDDYRLHYYFVRIIIEVGGQTQIRWAFGIYIQLLFTSSMITEEEQGVI